MAACVMSLFSLGGDVPFGAFVCMSFENVLRKVFKKKNSVTGV